MAFPKSDQRTAWETFVSVLQNDPILKREVKTWRTWSGDPEDKEDWSRGQVPYLRLTPHSDEARQIDVKSQRADILVDVTAVVAGTKVSDLIDFWEAITRALYPKDPTKNIAIDQRIKGAGIRNVQFPKPHWQVHDQGKDGGMMLVAEAQVRLWWFEQLHGF